MLYFVRQWGEHFFEVTKMKGYNHKTFFGYGTEICENDFSRLVLHCKPYSNEVDRIHSKLLKVTNKAYSEVIRWRGEGKANDIIPGLYPETCGAPTVENVLDRLGIQ